MTAADEATKQARKEEAESLIRTALYALNRIKAMNLTAAERIVLHAAYNNLRDLQNSVTEPDDATLKIKQAA